VIFNSYLRAPEFKNSTANLGPGPVGLWMNALVSSNRFENHPEYLY